MSFGRVASVVGRFRGASAPRGRLTAARPGRRRVDGIAKEFSFSDGFLPSGVTGASVRPGWSASAVPAGEDEDKDLGRVGSLERGQPIFLLADTLRHGFRGRFGACETKVRERRPRKWHGRGRRGENPREVKTHERIGSIRSGNTGWLAARTLTWLNPLKANPPRSRVVRPTGSLTVVPAVNVPGEEIRKAASRPTGCRSGLGGAVRGGVRWVGAQGRSERRVSGNGGPVFRGGQAGRRTVRIDGIGGWDRTAAQRDVGHSFRGRCEHRLRCSHRRIAPYAGEATSGRLFGAAGATPKRPCEAMRRSCPGRFGKCTGPSGSGAGGGRSGCPPEPRDGFRERRSARGLRALPGRCATPRTRPCPGTGVYRAPGHVRNRRDGGLSVFDHG
jgi:hypothetical protein